MKKNKRFSKDYLLINKKDIKKSINNFWKIFKIIIGVIAILISLVIFIKVLIPLILASIGALLLLILDYYTLTDPNFKMIWAFFMLVVFWKLLGIFSEAFFMIFDTGIELIKQKTKN